MLAQPESSAIRMNDGKCDDRGRFWAGSMAWDKTPGAGSLYRLDPDGRLAVTLTDVTISNGLAWPADSNTMYYIDTPTGHVDRFRVTDDGRLVERSTAVTVEGGFPDGMCIDDDGCLWVALWGGHAVHRYAPSGELLAVVEVGAPQVSSCCLGGPVGRTLFITTSQEGMDGAQRARHAQSGLLFCVEVDTAGPPAAAFRRAVSVEVVGLGETMALVVPDPPVPLAVAERLLLSHAGAESNVAVSLARLGTAVRWCSRVGDDPFGQRIRAELAAAGVDTSAVQVYAGGRTGVLFKDPDAQATAVRYFRDGSAAAAMDERRRPAR